MTEVKRNHHLPRFYLDGWADQKGRVALRRRGDSQAVLTSVGNVGVRNHFYTEGAESLFGRTETAAAPLVKRLRNDPTVIDDQASRRVLALFMVELMARQTYMATFRGLSHEVLAAILESDGDTGEVFRILRDEHGPYVRPENAEEIWREIEEFQQKMGREFPTLTPDEAKELTLEVVVDPNASRSLHSMVVEAEGSDLRNRWFGEFLLSREWLVCESAGKEFIVSDQPVFKHPTWLDRNGIGIQDILCFVASPTILLKMGSESGKCLWGEKEAHHFNLYTAKHCDHQIIATPSNKEYLSRIRLGKHRPWAFAESPQPPRVHSRVAS